MFPIQFNPQTNEWNHYLFNLTATISWLIFSIFFWIITPNYTPSKKLKKLFFNSSYRPKIPLNLQNSERRCETHKSNMPCPWISRGAFFQFGLQSYVDWGASQTALFQGKLIHQFSYLSFFFFLQVKIFWEGHKNFGNLPHSFGAY